MFLVLIENSRGVEVFWDKTRSDWWPDWPELSWKDEMACYACKRLWARFFGASGGGWRGGRMLEVCRQTGDAGAMAGRQGA